VNVVQKRNDELISILAPDFVRRNESTYAWKSANSMIQELLGLRGSWPMSSIDANGHAQDLSGHGNHITGVRSRPDYGLHNLVPYVELDGNDALISSDRADYDILGTEAFMLGAYRGLTLGGWWRLDTLQACGLIGKWNGATNNRSYQLDWWNNNNTFAFHITNNGLWANEQHVEATSYSEAVDTWYFVAARFDPGNENKIWVGAATDTALTADINATTHASIFNGAADLEIGYWNEGGGFFLDGDASCVFLCGSKLPDYVIDAMFAHTKRLFVG